MHRKARGLSITSISPSRWSTAPGSAGGQFGTSMASRDFRLQDFRCKNLISLNNNKEQQNKQ